MKILVVEDDDQLRALWQTLFQEAGHQCEARLDAREAQSVLLRTAFDLLVVDLHLGPESGLSVATLATYANPDCRVVVITGSLLFPRGELLAMSPGICTVLRKPVDVRELLAIAEYYAPGAQHIEARAS